jgi:hypothetical protein
MGVKLKNSIMKTVHEIMGKGIRSHLKKSFIAFIISYTVIIIFITNVMSQTDSTFNKEAIEEVMNGIRTTANASWWGFNEEDSTHALQEAILSKAKKIIVPNMGKPWVVEPIFLESDKEIIFEKGVIVAAKPGSFLGRAAALFSAMNKKNISLNGYGAEFIMRRQDYMKPPYENAEWRHCISIHGSQNIKIYGLRLADSGGDGICISRGMGKDCLPYSDNIHIKDVVCDNNYRQGISIGSASNLLIENCVFQHTAGTPPQDGIDFEPDLPTDVLIKCKVINCIIGDNFGVGIAIYVPALNEKSKPISIEIEGCQVLRNEQGAVFIAGKGTTNIIVPKGSVFIKNCNLEGKITQRDTQLFDVRFE